MTSQPQIDALELGEEGGAWIVRGTTDVDIAIAHVVRLVVDQLGGDDGDVGAEIVALTKAAEIAQVADLWYFLEDGEHDPLLRRMHIQTAREGGHGQELFAGVLLGLAHVQATRVTPANQSTLHIGRSWSAHTLEDGCPCPKAACGLVVGATVDAACPQHALTAGKAIRQTHAAEQCPATDSERAIALCSAEQVAAPEPVRTWDHHRKGRIVGVVVREDPEWIDLRCTEANRYAGVGEILTFRRTFATEVTS